MPLKTCQGYLTKCRWTQVQQREESRFDVNRNRAYILMFVSSESQESGCSRPLGSIYLSNCNGLVLNRFVHGSKESSWSQSLESQVCRQRRCPELQRLTPEARCPMCLWKALSVTGVLMFLNKCNKGIATSNKGVTASSKKLVVTRASLLVTRSY